MDPIKNKIQLVSFWDFPNITLFLNFYCFDSIYLQSIVTIILQMNSGSLCTLSNAHYYSTKHHNSFSDYMHKLSFFEKKPNIMSLLATENKNDK